MTSGTREYENGRKIEHRNGERRVVSVNGACVDARKSAERLEKVLYQDRVNEVGERHDRRGDRYRYGYQRDPLDDLRGLRDLVVLARFLEVLGVVFVALEEHFREREIDHPEPRSDGQTEDRERRNVFQRAGFRTVFLQGVRRERDTEEEFGERLDELRDRDGQHLLIALKIPSHRRRQTDEEERRGDRHDT